MAKVLSFKDMLVWQKGVTLSIEIFRLAKNFPKQQDYILGQQIQRCALSIPSNIAEGFNRDGTGEYIYHISVALGSCAELETQLIIAKEMGFAPAEKFDNLISEVNTISRMLKKLSLRLREKTNKPLTTKSYALSTN